MLQIVQAGQSDKAKYLIDMHRVRTKIFRDRMGWDVFVNEMELEIDEYDLPETIYILSVDEQDTVVGTWRFLLTEQPSMIRNIWPHYLKTLPIPQQQDMCETSRFGVHVEHKNKVKIIEKTNYATAEMIIGLIKLCMMCGITDMFTLYNTTVKRLLTRIGFSPYQCSEIINLEGKPTVTAQFNMDEHLLNAVQSKSGVDVIVTPNDLPPAMLERFIQHHHSINGARNDVSSALR